MTHPATKSHKHLVFKDGESNAILTGHVEALIVETGFQIADSTAANGGPGPTAREFDFSNPICG